MKNRKRIIAFTYAFLVAVIFYGCEGNVKEKATTYKFDGGAGVIICVIDSCEYVKVGSGQGVWGSHKGNCRFCAERSKRQF